MSNDHSPVTDRPLADIGATLEVDPSSVKARTVAGLCPKCCAHVAPTDQNCPTCRINLTWARGHLDELAGAEKRREPEPAAVWVPAPTAARPPLGCILTLGALMLLGLLPLASLDNASGTSLSEMLGPTLPGIGIGLGLVMAVGLVNWKTWALWLVIVLGGLGGIGWVVLTFTWLDFLSHYLGFLASIPLVVGLGMIGVAAWFYSHRRDFR